MCFSIRCQLQFHIYRAIPRASRCRFLKHPAVMKCPIPVLLLTSGAFAAVVQSEGRRYWQIKNDAQAGERLCEKFDESHRGLKCLMPKSNPAASFNTRPLPLIERQAHEGDLDRLLEHYHLPKTIEARVAYTKRPNSKSSSSSSKSPPSPSASSASSTTNFGSSLTTKPPSPSQYGPIPDHYGPHRTTSSTTVSEKTATSSTRKYGSWPPRATI
ncbi:hypothetical protein BDV96DRAFT_125122 [Lophiotrema nucula]|uniref:Uncharacterized protein n=1 Tax=Lophiotrema nucula TaxID=690887 RepID=A0A6A5Z1X9_9PLEO|nr:hypothetical protein BDV96DRAFT_125122 [Lophiotrema nucula]